MTGQVNGQPSSRALAVLVVAANLVLCGGVVAVLSVVRDGSAAAAFIPATTATTTTTTTEEPPPRAGPAPQDEPVPRDGPSAGPLPGPGSEFTEVSGAGGMTTHIPAGWQATSTTNPGSTQAEDPAGTTTVLRYGGSATPATDTYDLHADYERTFAADKEAYVSLRLERTVVRGAAAIDWEFEYGAADERRHVRSVYWLADGHEYFIYAAAPVPSWPQARKILDVMLTYSTP